MSHAAHSRRHSSQFGVGLRALGPWSSSGDAGGSRTRWTAVTALTSWVRRKACIPSRARVPGGRGGVRALPRRGGWEDPQDPLRVPSGHDSEQEQGGAMALLSEDLPSVVGTPGPGEGGGQARVGPAEGCVCGRLEGGTPGGLSGERLAHDSVRGVGLLPSYTGLIGRGRVDFSPASSTSIVTSPTSKSSSCGCRRSSAASSSDTPPGYVARPWFRYGAAFMGQSFLRACSRAVLLLWRDVADPSPFSRSVSPVESSRPDRLDVRHSLQYL